MAPARRASFPCMRSMRAIPAGLIVAAALAWPAGAGAACQFVLPDEPTSDDAVCGPINPPQAGGGGSTGSGSPPKLLAWTSGVDVNPFNGQRGGIWVARIDGSNRRQLTVFQNANRDWEPHGLNFPDDHPSFFPDNRKLVFTSNRSNGSNWEIYKMNVNGSGVTRLTTASGLDTEPVVSPDGARIAFTTERFGNLDIAVMNTDGSNLQRLTTSAQEDIEPAWSPDGSQIAFARVLGRGQKDVFVMNPDGTGQRRVTFTDGEDHDPSWFPDGQRLAITSERPPFSPPFGNVHRIQVSDGADLGDMTGAFDFGAGDPFVSKDGSLVAFFKSGLPVLPGPVTLFVMVASTLQSSSVPGEGIVNVHPAIGLAVDSNSNGQLDYLESGSVGTSSVAPRRLRAGRTRRVVFRWTHPKRWRKLDTLYLQLASRDALLGIVRHHVRDGSFSLFDRGRGAFNRSRRAGRGVIRSGPLAPDLGRSKIVHVNMRTIELVLAVRVARAAAGRWRVDVQADDYDVKNQEEALGRLRVLR